MKKQILSAAIAISCMANTLPLTALASTGSELEQGTFRYMPSFAEGAAQETYFYTDAYFSLPSTEENKHLCAMSMALAFSTFEIGDSSYAVDLLEQIGYEDILVTDMTAETSADTIGTAIAHKRVDGQDMVAVAVKGSKYQYEWLSDLTAGAEGDHQGFASASQKVTDRIASYIADHQLDDVKFWITGFSRGGAVADLAGVYINEHMAEFETAPEDLYVYTFATPLCSASDTVYDNIWCVLNRNDLVTYVYPADWGMHRNGREVLLGEEKTITSATADVFGGMEITKREEVLVSEFLPEFFHFISEELTREVYAKNCDQDVPALMEVFLNRPLEEWGSLINYLKNDLLPAAQEKEAERLGHLLIYDIAFGISAHNSDAMYAQLTKDLRALILEAAAETDCPFSDAELTVIADHLYGLLRAAGPVLIRDSKYALDADYSTLLPEGYDDPTFVPSANDAPDYETYCKMTEELQREMEEIERNKTQEERDADAGRDAAYRSDAYDRGYDDAANGNEPLTEAVMPEDADSFSAAYLESYAETYMRDYKDGYESALHEAEPYQIGHSLAYDPAYEAAVKDAAAGQYKASYDETVPPAEDGLEQSEEYVNGYLDYYREVYDSVYEEYAKKAKERPFYHFGTFFSNIKALATEHYAQTYFSLIKAYDPYYETLTTETAYLDENGEPQTVMAYPFDPEDPVLVNRWYAVSGDVTVDHALILGTDVGLILTDGSSLTVNGVRGGETLTVYAQEGGSGKLTSMSPVSAEAFVQHGGTVQLLSDTEDALACTGDVSIMGGSFSAEKAIRSGGTITLDYKNANDTITAGTYHAAKVTVANDHVFYIPDFPKVLITDHTCNDIGTVHLTYNGETQKVTKDDLLGKVCYFSPVVSSVTISDALLDLMQGQVLVPDPGVSPYADMLHRTLLTAEDFDLGEVQEGKEVSEDGYPSFYTCEVIGKGDYSGTASIDWWIEKADVSEAVAISPKGDIPYTGKSVTAEQFTFTASSALGQELLDALEGGTASLKQRIFAAKELPASETTDVPEAERYLATGHIYDLHELIGNGFLVIRTDPFTVVYPTKLDSTIYVMQDGVKMPGCIEIDEEGALCYHQTNADGEDVYVRELPQAYTSWRLDQDNNTLTLDWSFSGSQRSDGIAPGDYVIEFTISDTGNDHFEDVVKYVPFTVLPEQIASDEMLCAWAQKDYTDKTGTEVSAAVETRTAQDLTIVIKDKDGNTVDTYVIDAATGTGKDAAGQAVDLPQTGNNDWRFWVMLLGAACMTGAGWYCLKRSGIRLRRKAQ